jgi:hypothetical protein
MTKGHPYAQWFRPLGKCSDCPKPATGELMDHRNDNRGVYCQKCAERAIKTAHKSGLYWPDAAIVRSE